MLFKALLDVFHSCSSLTSCSQPAKLRRLSTNAAKGQLLELALAICFASAADCNSLAEMATVEATLARKTEEAPELLVMCVARTRKHCSDFAPSRKVLPACVSPQPGLV